MPVQENRSATVLMDDQLIFLGKVAEWLKTEPDGKVEYGEYYVSKVEISFDGEVIGRFVSDDPSWLYEVPQ